MTIFIVWSHFDIFLEKYSSCNGHSKLFNLLFRDNLMLIFVAHHAQILDLVVHFWDKGVFRRERLRKGCNISILIWVHLKKINHIQISRTHRGMVIKFFWTVSFTYGSTELTPWEICFSIIDYYISYLEIRYIILNIWRKIQVNYWDHKSIIEIISQ